ncbi:MAG TPA: efflux RND transporter periplasmic adaptor subunit [Syntrophales bacterium]|nr:efflux RND transporter periplasmic adaptor subunit [Syntrophales bacterium]
MAADDLSRLKIDKAAKTVRTNVQKRPMLIIGAAVLVVLAAVLYWMGVFTPAQSVEVAMVSQTYPSQSFTLLNASGYVVAQRKSAVASKITSRLVELSVEEGSRVKKGDIIARLEGEDTQAARDQAQANLSVSRYSLLQARAELDDAKASFERERELLAQEYTTKASFDAAEARYKKAIAGVSGAESAVRAADAALEATKVSMEYTLLRAPFDAVVLTKNADIGDIVTPLGAAANAKAAVVTIADMNSLQVEADVSESNLEQVKKGQPCEIQLDALPEKRFRGEVHMVIPTADRSKATVMVKVRFLDIDPRVLPEMSAKVAFLSKPVGPGEEKPRTTIHPAAVVSRDGKSAAFVVKDNRVEEQEITTGEKMGDLLVVTGGVKAGDRVVLNPPKGLKSGSRVKQAEK